MKKELRLLYIEHNPTDREIVQESLRLNLDYQFKTAIASTGSAGLEMLKKERYDIVLVDYKLPGMSGIQILKRAKEENIDIPIIMVTGTGDERIAVEAMKAGAYDYVVKDISYKGTLPIVINRALERYNNSRETEQLKKALEEERKQLLSIFEHFDEPIYVVDPENYRILYANSYLKKLCGPDIAGKICYRVFQNKEGPCEFCSNDRIFGDNLGKTYVWELQNLFSKRWYRCIDRAIKWSDGRMVRCEVAIDITDRKEVEENLDKKLQKKLAELEKEKAKLEMMNKFMIGRELRMIELKKEVNTLLKELGRPTKYGHEKQEKFDGTTF